MLTTTSLINWQLAVCFRLKLEIDQYSGSEVSLAQGLVIDHAPPTIEVSYDKALLWTTKKTVLMRDLSTDRTDSSYKLAYLGFTVHVVTGH